MYRSIQTKRKRGKYQKMKKIVVGGGCFWCLEAVYNRVIGVMLVEPGYAGGFVSSPDYRSVCSDVTGHAEVVQVTYDPKVISLDDLLRIFFDSHDPTTLNRQGADSGTQYRSAIFYDDASDVGCIDEIINECQSQFRRPIVTQVNPLDVFYHAEDEHKAYYENHAGNGYCQIVIQPKLQNLMTNHKDKVKID
jgi:methionine-S-sulfoxide reductase